MAGKGPPALEEGGPRPPGAAPSVDRAQAEQEGLGRGAGTSEHRTHPGAASWRSSTAGRYLLIVSRIVSFPFLSALEAVAGYKNLNFFHYETFSFHAKKSFEVNWTRRLLGHTSGTPVKTFKKNPD